MEQEWSGSTLSGRKINGWLEGEGRCVLPNGVVYEGQFKGGNFHGRGVLIYPDGGRYTAEWEDGLAVSGNYSFKDGLAYQLENWTYLAPSDRRFVKEVQEGFDPQWTVQQRMTKMPRGTYDTGDGYFSGDTGELRSFDGRSLVAVPNALFANWIITHCKRGGEGHSKSNV